MITSADNPKVKQARALLTRRGRRQAGDCLVEGVRLVEEAMRAGVLPALVFYLDAAKYVPRTEQLLRDLHDAAVPLAELSSTLFGTLSDTVTSQGVIAVVAARSAPLTRQVGFLLVLDGMRDPGNLGTVLRGAEAAGVQLALLTPGCVDPWSPKAMRAGMGAQFRLPLITSVSEQELSHRTAKCPLWLADAAGRAAYDAIDWTVPCALAIGGETTGFDAKTVALSVGSVRIPMHGESESLNASMAATVLMFEVARQRRRSTTEI